MSRKLPISLLALLSLVTLQSAALPSLFDLVPRSLSGLEKRQAHNFETSANGTNFLWVIQDTYEGASFYECVDMLVWCILDWS